MEVLRRILELYGAHVGEGAHQPGMARKGNDAGIGHHKRAQGDLVGIVAAHVQARVVLQQLLELRFEGAAFKRVGNNLLAQARQLVERDFVARGQGAVLVNHQGYALGEAGDRGYLGVAAQGDARENQIHLAGLQIPEQAAGCPLPHVDVQAAVHRAPELRDQARPLRALNGVHRAKADGVVLVFRALLDGGNRAIQRVGGRKGGRVELLAVFGKLHAVALLFEQRRAKLLFQA